MSHMAQTFCISVLSQKSDSIHTKTHTQMFRAIFNSQIPRINPSTYQMVNGYITHMQKNLSSKKNKLSIIEDRRILKYIYQLKETSRRLNTILHCSICKQFLNHKPARCGGIQLLCQHSRMAETGGSL